MDNSEKCCAQPGADAPAIERETVRLCHRDGSWIQGHWSRSAQGCPWAVVYVHGFRSIRSGDKSRALEAECLGRGWTFAAFDFRGHGESSGTMRELRGSRLLQDLELVRDFLCSKDVRRLALVGSSMGGWAAAWFALDHPESIAAIALIAPGFHFLRARWDRLTPQERQRWQQQGYLHIRNEWVDTELGYGIVEEIPKYPPERLTRGLRTPTLIFQGMKDELVPYQRTIAFVEQVQAPIAELRLYKDGDHRLTDRKEELARSACDFFDRWFGARSSGETAET